VMGLPERPTRRWGDIFSISLCGRHFSGHYSVPPFVLRSGGIKRKQRSLCAVCSEIHTCSAL
jgi:hypothetical protein